MRRLAFLSAALGLAAAASMAGAAGPARADEPTQAGSAPAFRVCADPDNLPFSSSNAATPGLYVELGQDIAKDLGRPFEPVWTLSYFGKRTVRTTLLAGKCDAYIGLPKGFMGPSLIFSKPFMTTGFALVVPADMTVTSLNDLKGKKVAVQFATPPQTELADNHDDITEVTVLSPEEGMDDIAAHKADAAFVWGPTAGYINATSAHNAYKVIPIDGNAMQWPVFIGFAKSDTALRDQVNAALDKSAAAIEALRVKYGFPTATPIALGGTAPAAAPSAPPEPKHADAGAPIQKAAASAAVATPAAGGKASQIAAGREIFNGMCAHCHGPDAVQSETRINLRLLKHRYGDKMDQVFHYTVTHGRPDKGMPNWTGVYTEKEFNEILAFLHSVQQSSS